MQVFMQSIAELPTEKFNCLLLTLILILVSFILNTVFGFIVLVLVSVYCWFIRQSNPTSSTSTSTSSTSTSTTSSSTSKTPSKTTVTVV